MREPSFNSVRVELSGIIITAVLNLTERWPGRIPFHSQISEKSEKSEKFTLYSYKKGKLQISLLTHKDFIEFRKFEVFLS